jgi:hypothetical protein
MGAARKYDSELMERAVRMYRDRLAGGSDSKVGARRHVGALLDVNPATLRNWIEAEDQASRPAPAVRSSTPQRCESCGGRTPNCAEPSTF